MRLARAGISHNDREWNHPLDQVLLAAEIIPLAGQRPPDWQERMGIAMHIMNIDAVNARYQEGNEYAGYRFRWELAKPVQVLKSLECWLYQCAEGDIPERPLYKAFQKLKGYIAVQIISRTKEYEEAQWG